MTFLKPVVTDKNLERTRSRVRGQLEGSSIDMPNAVFKWVLRLTLSFCLAVLVTLLTMVITGSYPLFMERAVSFLANGYTSKSATRGVFQGLRGTFWIGICVVGFAFPVGISAAVYLEEYASNNWFNRLINVNIRNLAGVPSVVYGLLGLAVFVELLDGVAGVPSKTLGQTTIAGGLTLAVLSLPVVIITASEAIRAVPTPLRQAAYGVGATKSQVIRSHILPHAAPGIFTGSLLALARALGEAAPLIVVGAVSSRLGSSTGLFDPSQLGEKFTAMPMVITAFVGQPGEQWRPLASAAIVVLLVVVLGFNVVAVLLRNRFEGKREG